MISYNLDLTQVKQGKVRDIYKIGTDHLLLVATDRVSAFDVVLPSLIPEKGKVLTKLSKFWFNKTRHIISNHWHMANVSINELDFPPKQASEIEGRAMLVKRCEPLLIEAIVRGYLVKSVMKEYMERGFICGIPHPPGLELGSKLPIPLYTPTTKAPDGEHDQNITYGETAKLLGGAIAEQVRSISLRLYNMAYDYAFERGIIIADTKFEFGLVPGTNQLVLIDELLTPDSSRYWRVEDYYPGEMPPSRDKQQVRDYLDSIGWNRVAPAPSLPNAVIQKTAQTYQEVQDLLIQDSYGDY